MQILNYPVKINTPTAVALGYFDGVHTAHNKILTCAAENSSNLVPVVFTFSEMAKSASGCLTTNKEKHSLFEKSGIEILVSADFSSLCSKSAEEFVREVLLNNLSAKAVYCGYNYRFGKGASADVSTLKALCEKEGIDVFVTEEITEDGTAVSSSAIKALLQSGEVLKASQLLGRSYSLTGEIVHGNALGRTISTPTLNIRVSEDKLLPRFGVYAALVNLGNSTFKAVANIGMKPTVGSDVPTVEAYLISESGDFYGEEATLFLQDFIRDERKFENLEELKAQIRIDTEKAEAILRDIEL